MPAATTRRRLKPGVYVITDPSYLIEDEPWQEWIATADIGKVGQIEFRGETATLWPTAHGDGVFPVRVNHNLIGHAGVDSGMIAAFPAKILVTDPSLGPVIKSLVDDDLAAVAWIKGGPVRHDPESGLLLAGDLSVGDADEDIDD